jgi:3-oxoacyl-[acyl-carrier protein] reductase
MMDRYANFAQSGAGRGLIRRLGLPEPPRLHRYRPKDPLVTGPVLVGTGHAGRVAESISKILNAAGVEVVETGAQAGAGVSAGAEVGVGAGIEAGNGTRARPRLHAALVYDATGITEPADLSALYDFFHPYARSLYPCGRVIVCGTPPDLAGGTAAATAQRALEGFVRSVGKEFGRGITANLVQVAPGAETTIESTLRFLLSARSAYVSGQVVRVDPADVVTPADADRPLAGRVAVVTGAARGIGAAIVEVLSRDGAHVVCVDLADAGDTLAQVANDAGGEAVQADLTDPDAPHRLVEHLSTRHGRVDIVVHNAGITRDRTLAKMDRDTWHSVLDVNLLAVTRLTGALLGAGLIGPGGRLVGVSSVSGIAGNRGQTNYATSKAGVIGLVESTAPELAPRGITINAVAPGFIETRLTARMPKLTREAGRRLNSMAQAGLPVDVAEAVAWFASPASTGLSGQVVRVCGQSLLGA